ncbi:MAG: immunoglobulin domain-containing protein, partial [Salinivirgaceae bacterium]|nr:immunoglobulin domain-containing protein [Salinivirgaceae bacterium]
MRKLITLLLMAISMSTLIKAQDFDFYISDPVPVPEPLEFCMGETVTFTLDYLGWGWSDWLMCSEAPDLEGYSNFNLWEPVYPTDNSYTLTVSREVYFWVKVSEDFTSSNSEVFHIQLKGAIPEIVYSDTAFCGGTTLTISCSIDNLGDGKYQWYKDNLLIEGATNAILEISEEGSYFVSALTNESGCPNIYYSSAPVNFYYIKPELVGTFKPDLERVTL